MLLRMHCPQYELSRRVSAHRERLLSSTLPGASALVFARVRAGSGRIGMIEAAGAVDPVPVGQGPGRTRQRRRDLPADPGSSDPRNEGRGRPLARTQLAVGLGQQLVNRATRAGAGPRQQPDPPGLGTTCQWIAQRGPGTSPGNTPRPAGRSPDRRWSPNEGRCRTQQRPGGQADPGGAIARATKAGSGPQQRPA